jgi:DNA-binding NarL/FixJ family response regulator
LVQILQGAGFQVMETSSGEEALKRAHEAPPSIALLEVALDDVSGYEVCRALREEHGESVPIVFVSGTRTQSYDRVAGLLLGANDYIVKPYAVDELLARVRKLIRFEQPLPTSVQARLTKREAEVLRLLADGRDPEEIAARLFITRKTVASHIENVRRKLGVRSRTQAVALAYRTNIIDAGDVPE